MKKIGRHATHVFALLLALIMVFGTVSLPVLAITESGATSQETGSTPSTGGTDEGGEDPGSEGTVTTPWYVLEYSYDDMKMSLTLKADIFSYTDITASGLSDFKDALMDALAYMLVGDISSIKKPDAASGDETLNAAVAEALYFVMLTDLLTEGAAAEGDETEGTGAEGTGTEGGSGTSTTLSSERVQQLREFFEARGITKVSQVNISEMIPVLVQLGYITYDELAALTDDDWNKIFEVFEEEVEKEIAEDMAAEDMAAEDMAAEDMAAEDMAAEEIAKDKLKAQGTIEPDESATEEEKQQYADALAPVKNDVLNATDEETKKALDEKKTAVKTDETKKEELAAKKDEVLTATDEETKKALDEKKTEVKADETKKEELAAKKDEVLADPDKKGDLADKKNDILTDEDKKTEIDQKKEESGAMKDIADAKQEVIETVDKNKDDADANEISDVNLTKAILDAMRYIKIDGETVYDGKHLLSDGLRAVIEALPTLAEISEYTDEEMTHTWKVSADSAFGPSEFDFILSLDGDCEPIRRAAGLFADYVVFERREDGGIILTLNLPQKFADLLLRVCNRDEFKNSEWWDRIFDNIFSDGNDIYALLNDASFADILDALEDFDFNGVIGEEEIKDIYGSELTNEEILEKIRATETLYNKALSLFNKIFSSLSDTAKKKTIFDLYDGNGVFHASGSRDGVNVEETLSRLLPEAYKSYASLIAGMMEEQTITVAADVTVRFTGMHRVTFMGDTTQYAFLPAGAVLSDFAKAMTYKGYPIVGWSDQDGNQRYVEMPDADTVLYPVIDVKATAKINVSGNLEKVYDDKSITLTVSVDYDDVYGRADYTYQWYKDGNQISGATAATLTLKNVSDSGKYSCVVTVTDGADTFPAASDAVTVSVTKRLYTFAENFAWDYSAPFLPDGASHTVTLVPKNIDAYADVSISYTGDSNTQSAVGRYTTDAVVTFGNENCALSDTVKSLTWAIGVRELPIKDASGNRLGTVTLLTNGVAADPTLSLVARAAGALDPNAVKEKLPNGADKVATYAYELVFLDEAGNEISVASELSLSIDLTSTVAASHLAVLAVNGTSLAEVASERDGADKLAFTSDAFLTAKKAVYALVSYQYKLTLGAQGYTGTYDGAEHTIDATVSYAGSADAAYTYQWYKDGSLLVGANASSYKVKNVAQSGSYELWVTVKDGYAEHTEKVGATVAIAKLSVDLSALTWSATELPYTGGEQEVTVKLTDAASIANLSFTYSGNKATASGDYTATATVASYDTDNSEVRGTLPTHVWSISSKSYAVTDHYGNSIIVSSDTAFSSDYRLAADWIGTYDGTLPSLGEAFAAAFVGGHTVYFKDASDTPVAYTGTLSVKLTVPASLRGQTIRLVTVKNGVATLTETTRDGDVLTFTTDGLDQDTSYLLVAYRTLIDTSGVSIDALTYRIFDTDREIEITRELLKGLPEGVIASIDTTFGDYSASAVGTYTVRVHFSLEEDYRENYAPDVSYRDIQWEIKPYDFTFDLIWNYGSALTYCGEEYVLYVPAAERYADYLKIDYTGNRFKNAGSYEVKIAISPKTAYEGCCTVNGGDKLEKTRTFTVAPKMISSDLLVWDADSFVYDGEAHRPTLSIPGHAIDGIYDPLADIIEIGEYTGAFGIHVLDADADPYVVTVALSVKNANYTLTQSSLSKTWQITPKALSLDGVKLERELFDYDGTVKTAVPDLSSLPEELTAFLDPATEIRATEKGTYQVVLVLQLKAGHRAADYTFTSRMPLSYSIKTPIDPTEFRMDDIHYTYDGTQKNAPALVIPSEYSALLSVSGTGDLAATDAGTYTLTYSFTLLSSEEYYLTATSHSLEWTIAKKQISLPELTWTDADGFVYNGNAFTVELLTSTDPVLTFTYGGVYSATDAGEYLATVAFALTDADNYELVGESTAQYAWTIRQATVSVGAFGWQENLTFDYDGEEKTVSALLPTLPDGVTFTYEGNAATDAGSYVAKVILNHADKNYRVVIGDTDTNVAEKAWEILPIRITVGELTWNLTEREFVYSEEERSFLVTSTLPAHVSVNYVVEGNVTNVIGNVGTYTVRVLLVADQNYVIADEAERSFTFTVTKKTITVDASSLAWVTSAASNRYDAKEHTYTLRGMPAHVTAAYEGNSATKIGTYVASATLLPESDNYELVVNGQVPSKTWSIIKGIYDMSGVTFEDATFTYDGRRHSLTVSGNLPKGVEAVYSQKDKVDAGVYEVTVTFKGSDNYEPIPSMSAVMTILRETYTVSGSDGEEKLVITTPSGLTYQLVMDDVDASDYKDLSFSGIGTLNQNITPHAAYDIYFVDGVDGEAHPDGTFTVKILIPENLRSKTLKVVHLTDDGVTVDVKAAREGDYMIFTTDGFSIYLLVEATAILSDLVLMIILIAICVLLVVLIVLHILLRRRRAKRIAESKEYPNLLKDVDLSAFDFGGSSPQ